MVDRGASVPPFLMLRFDDDLHTAGRNGLIKNLMFSENRNEVGEATSLQVT